MQKEREKHSNSIEKLLQAQRKLKIICEPFETGTWIVGGLFAFFFVAVAGYGMAGDFAGWIHNLVDVMPTVGLCLAPAATISVCRIGGNRVINALISHRYAKQYENNVYDQKKVDYVATRFKEGVNNIVHLSKTQDKAKMKAVAEDIKRVERETKLSAKEEKAVEEQVGKFIKGITKGLSVAERKQLAKVFLDLGR
ncbi:MAG: hypothetical protein J6S74_00845 [Alphaproteobacteria bacterium]|nr:hypothetical protein [Alphaproteobacteria bacterium]